MLLSPEGKSRPENSRRSEGPFGPWPATALEREAKTQAAPEAAAVERTKAPNADVSGKLFEQRPIKLQPELRHVLTHLYYAIDHLIHSRSLSAKAELLSVEGLVFFDGGDDDYEKWFQKRADELAEVAEESTRGE